MDQKSKKPTIYDLAQLTGISAGTVSAVLNGSWEKRRISAQTAAKVKRIADENGYAVNMQASALRKEKSGIIGMILPMYDNRFFSSIAQNFEQKARDMGCLPITICTHREPELEMEAVKAMLLYQAEFVVCTGSTDPDRLHDLCAKFGVPTFNLDLPGTKSASVISDNYEGALHLTRKLLTDVEGDCRMLFIGGHEADHNTKERIRGFVQAHVERHIQVEPDQIIACGYEAAKAKEVVEPLLGNDLAPYNAMFINSTISLEGVTEALSQSGVLNKRNIVIGCFDWDPLVAVFKPEIAMVRQDVETMLSELFRLIKGGGDFPSGTIEIPPILNIR